MIRVSSFAPWRGVSSNRLEVVAIVAVTAVAFAVRATFVLFVDFPVNDGGMFYSAVSEIEANSWRLPAELDYNEVGIPFAYPPLAFYLARVFEVLTGADTLTSLRVLPLVFSTATVPPFYFLARSLAGKFPSFVAAWLFALVPRIFDWQIAGGGLTRAPGLFFAIIAIACVARIAFRGGRRPAAIGAGVACGLAVLTHPQMGLFVGYSAAVFLAFARDRRVAGQRLALSLGIAALVALPWLVFVVARLGLDPFVAASQTGTHDVTILQVFGSSAFNEPLFPIFAALGGVGMAWCIGHRHWLLPSWVAAVAVLDPRKAETLSSAPVALLGAFALAYVLMPLLGGETVPATGGDSAAHGFRLPQRLGVYVVLGFVLIGGILAPVRDTSPIRTLTADVREAMERIDDETPESARFVVVNGDEYWALDALSEWFPVLAGRPSLATVQGTEWLSGGEFRARMTVYDDLQSCADREAECLAAWSDRYGYEFDYVFIPQNVYTAYGREMPDGCCALLLSSLDRSPQYELVIDSSGGRAYRRRWHSFGTQHPPTASSPPLRVWSP